jgi:hypothetical protein
MKKERLIIITLISLIIFTVTNISYSQNKSFLINNYKIYTTKIIHD